MQELACECKPQACKAGKVCCWVHRKWVGWGERTGGVCSGGAECLCEGTFAGTDHLKHHLRSPPVVQPCLLVQEPLLLHLFLLGQSQAVGPSESRLSSPAFSPHVLILPPCSPCSSHLHLLIASSSKSYPLELKSMIYIWHSVQGWTWSSLKLGSWTSKGSMDKMQEVCELGWGKSYILMFTTL